MRGSILSFCTPPPVGAKLLLFCDFLFFKRTQISKFMGTGCSSASRDSAVVPAKGKVDGDGSHIVARCLQESEPTPSCRSEKQAATTEITNSTDLSKARESEESVLKVIDDLKVMKIRQCHV